MSCRGFLFKRNKCHLIWITIMLFKQMENTMNELLVFCIIAATFMIAVAVIVVVYVSKVLDMSDVSAGEIRR